MTQDLATVIIDWHLKQAIDTITLEEIERNYDDDGNLIREWGLLCNEDGELINLKKIIEENDIDCEGNVIARIDKSIYNQDDDVYIAQNLLDKYDGDKDLYIINVSFEDDISGYNFLVQ